MHFNLIETNGNHKKVQKKTEKEKWSKKMEQAYKFCYPTLSVFVFQYMPSSNMTFSIKVMTNSTGWGTGLYKADHGVGFLDGSSVMVNVRIIQSCDEKNYN